LTALANFVDRIVILEGKWKGYEGIDIRSTDDTQGEIFRFIFSRPLDSKVKIRYMQSTEELHQYEARNQLLDQVPEGDWFLMIDSDEIFTSWARDTNKLLESMKDSKGLCIYSYDDTEKTTEGKRMDLPKILRKTKGLHMTTNHRYYDDDAGKIVYNQRDFPEAPVFCFTHKGQFKKERQNSERYKDWLVRFENS